MNKLEALIKRASRKQSLSPAEVARQLNTLTSYKSAIGAPVRLAFITAEFLKPELAKKFCKAIVDRVIQVILDKDPIKDVPGTEKSPELDFIAFVTHCGDLFTAHELSEINAAMKKAATEFPEFLILRAAKEVASDRSKVKDVADLLLQLREHYNTVEAEPDPFDDPENWIGDGLDEDSDTDEEQVDDSRMKKYYDRVYMRGVAIRQGKKMKLVDVRDFVDEIKRRGEKSNWIVRRLKEKIVRFAGVHSDIVRKLYLVIDPKERTLFNVAASAKGVMVTERDLDVISFATSNKPGIMVLPKSRDRVYADERYQMSPEADTAKVKRAPGTSIHYAVKLEDRREYVAMNITKSSTQAIVAFPLEDAGFERLSNNVVSEHGNGVIIGETIGRLLDKLGVKNAKFNIAFLKSKGIGIYRRRMVAKVEGKEIEVDAVFDLQESRGFDRALFVPACKAMRAYLDGKPSVEIKQGDEFTPVVGEIDGMKVLLGIAEMQVDLSVDRSVSTKKKHTCYPQMKAFAPESWAQLSPLLNKRISNRRHVLERTARLIRTYRRILEAIGYKPDVENRDLAKNFDKVFNKSKYGSRIPEGFAPAVKIIKDKVRWQDAALKKEDVEMILSAKDEFVIFRGIKLRPVKLLIKHEGRVMISPELRMLLSIVLNDNDRSRRSKAFNSLERYFLFVLRHFRKEIQPYHRVVAGRHATGAFDRGALLPFKPELVKQLLRQATALSDADIEQLIEAGVDAVNMVMDNLKFRIQRDPVLKEIPVEKVRFSEDLTMDVIVVGKETAKHINGDDDDDIVYVWWYGKKQLGGSLLSGILAAATGHREF